MDNFAKGKKEGTNKLKLFSDAIAWNLTIDGAP